MVDLNRLYNEDCVAFMEDKLDPETINLLYTDVPYNMGSRYIIDPDTGHYRFKGKGSDFMNQWDAMDGLWWNRWFAAAHRVIKEGGFLVTHNIDRQADLWTYYARRNGFLPIQKLYWLFIDSFPKGVDVGLKVDGMLGVEREKVGLRKRCTVRDDRKVWLLG
jgi:DNA modification methylase